MSLDRVNSDSRSWCSEKLQDVASSLLTEELVGAGREIIDNRRLLDFVILPGLISAKIQQDNSRPTQVRIEFSIIEDRTWDIILQRLASKAYFLARMLAGDFPHELETVFSDSGAELVPRSLDQLKLTIEGVKADHPSPAVSAVVLRLLDKLDEDPFSLFTLLGRGRDETIAEIRRLRSRNTESRVAFAPQPQLADPEIMTSLKVDNFWKMSAGLTELTYNIKADELPGSVLKWLDPLPLGGLEAELDHLLEEAYARIARLAQSFGIGL